ncbi:hypothetical protein M0R04_10495 [Candidatus Dojkabacteria bacterium]|jgi:hypothetical protein|nr:hypothetical protein [Candidatus Dojkabacteria bacterium]
MAYKLNKSEPAIRKSYNPSDEQLKVRKHVYDRYSSMKDKRADFDKDWDKWMKQWDGFRQNRKSEDWKSNINIPMTASIIEAMLAELNNQELKPWVLPRGSEDEGKATVMNAILDFTWDTAKSDVALMEIIKDALIIGTGIGQEYFWREPRTLKDSKGNENKVLEYDDCYLEPVKAEDFYVDEKARSFSGPYGARDAIRRYIMDYDDFRTFFTGKKWNPFNAAQHVKPGGDTNYYEYYKPPERLEHDHEVEVLWYWNKPEDLLAIVANDVLVYSGPNIYKHKQLPFVRVIDVLRPHHFYGKGEPELLESLQEENNTLRRMIIDRNHLDIDKPILVSDTLTMEDEDAIARPHGIIPVGDVNAVKPLEYSDIPLSVFKSLELLVDDKVRITGMDERQMSVQKAGTATEAAILKEATLKRLGLKIWQIKNDTLVDLGKLRVSNIIQFYSEPKIKEIVGEEEVARAQAKGVIISKGGKKFETSYRSIRLQDQKLEMDKTNNPKIVPTRGTTFFDAKPSFFTPTHGGYDIRYKATSSLPISKPLEQQKADEMYDRLSMNETVDQWKLAEFLIESRDKVPEDFKIQQPGQKDEIKLQSMIDLAGVENDEMMRGNKIGPTPYASPVHTEQHVTFMKSEKFKKDVPVENSEQILQIFSDHVMGEVTAQTARGEAGGASSDGGSAVPPGNEEAPAPSEEGNMETVVPGRMMGGDEVPSGMAGANSGVQTGRKV